MVEATCIRPQEMNSKKGGYQRNHNRLKSIDRDLHVNVDSKCSRNGKYMEIILTHPIWACSQGPSK